MWRLVVSKEDKESFNETADYVLEELKILKECVKRIRRYCGLDYKSAGYFQFLDSCIDQLASMLNLQKVIEYKQKRGD